MTARRTIIAVFTAIICLTASSAMAVQAVWENSCWWRDGRIAADLRLTRYEVDQLEYMQRGVNQRMAELNNRILQAHRSIDGELGRRNPHMDRVEREIRTIEQATAELAGLHLRHDLDVRRLLGQHRYNQAQRQFNWQRHHQHGGPVLYSVTN